MRYFYFALLIFLLLKPSSSISQVIQLGKGSYTKTLPSDQSGASDQFGNPILPNVAGNFTKLSWSPSYIPVTTNEYWSNILFRYAANEPSHIYAHPLQFKVDSTGITLGHALNSTFSIAGSNFLEDYSYYSEGELMIGLKGVQKSGFKAVDYSDWTVTTAWQTDSTSLEATLGHGLPFVYIKTSGADIQLTANGSAHIWQNDGHVLGVTIHGKHYGIFAPSGTKWNDHFPLTSDLNGKGFISIAILPDSNPNTLEFFKNHAYAFVSDTKAEWAYDSSSNKVTVSYTATTTQMEQSETYANHTILALYRHQWLHTNEGFTAYSYPSPRGEMKVLSGNTFSTENTFIGILPFLPDVGKYDRLYLNELLDEEMTRTLSSKSSTYTSGKEMGRVAQLIHIADQLGNLRAKNNLLFKLKVALQNWLTADGDQYYFYDENWQVLIGYPAAHGSNTRLNDQHFHHGYAIYAAATIAKFDPDWALNENWGEMINLLIKNASSWNRKEKNFPYLRNFDIYAGHSWASGDGSWFVGNNQESSSESIHYAASTFLWGEITGQDEIRDVGAYLYTLETEAANQYWFDIDNEVFPDGFDYSAAGMVTGAGAIYGTWFSTDIEKIHGINFLPFTAASLYLGTNPNYVKRNYEAIIEQLGNQPQEWKDILWSYLALYDPNTALNYLKNDSDYQVFDGESKARTLHWLYNLDVLGQVSDQVQADIPTYNVFIDTKGDTTYVAYNSDSSAKRIRFSNGFSFEVDAFQTKVYNRSMAQDTIGRPTLKPEYESLTVVSLFSDLYEAATKFIFVKDENQTTNAQLTSIANNNVIVLESLEEQKISFETKIDLSTRSHLFSQIWSNHEGSVRIELTQGQNVSESVVLNLTKNTWNNPVVDLQEFGDNIDYQAIDGIIVNGTNTIVMDDLIFFGDTPVKAGPDSSAVIRDILPEHVLSLFSDHFTDIDGIEFIPPSSESTVVTYYTLDQDSVLKIENLDTYTIYLDTPLDVSAMNNLHLNYWTQESSEFSVHIVSNDGKESTYVVDVIKHEWQELEIDLKTFFSEVNLNEVTQISFSGNRTIFLDNLLFYTYPDLTVSPTPTQPAEQVLSIFGDHYGEYRSYYSLYSQMDETEFTTSFDEASVEIANIDGDEMLYYDNTNYSILEFFRGQRSGLINAGIDGSKFTNVRFDFYTQDKLDASTRLEFKLVDFGGDGYGGGNDSEDAWYLDIYSSPSLTNHSWISVDIDLDELPRMTQRKNLSQMVFKVIGGLQYYYLDNIYFYSDQSLNSNEEINALLPKKLDLHQNYPNPFNPTTNIQFELPHSGYTTLKIYNSLGQLVQTLADSFLSAGNHLYNFDANNHASGVYFYQLRFGNEIMTRKMILLK